MLAKIVISIAVMAASGLVAGTAYKIAQNNKEDLAQNSIDEKVELIASIPAEVINTVKDIAEYTIIISVYLFPVSLPLIILNKNLRAVGALVAYVYVTSKTLMYTYNKAYHIASI